LLALVKSYLPDNAAGTFLLVEIYTSASITLH
jgi:hypothetical protein